MYPSKGLEIVGFEIKVSRSDLLNELKHPEKADEIGKFCDTWVLVVPKGLIKDSDEIPTYWGILEVSEDLSIRTKKRPLRKETVPINKSFLTSILRRVSKFEADYIEEKATKLALEKVDAAVARSRSVFEELRDDRTRQAKKAVKFCEDFKERTDIDVLGSYYFSNDIFESFNFAIKYKLFGYQGIMSKFNELKKALSIIDEL